LGRSRMKASNCSQASVLDEPPRKSGIEVIGEVPWGTHSCLLYTTGEELLEVMGPYFAQGLASNEFCIWVTSEPLSAAEARAGLEKAVPQLDEHCARGQIEILDYQDWYFRNGRFEADAVLRAMMEKLAWAEERGFDGLRLAGNTSRLEKTPWKGFARYEAMIDRIISSNRMIALCSYPLPKCNLHEIFDVIANHDFALIKEEGRWLPFKSFGRQRLERALRESEARQRTIIEAVKDAIIAFEKEGTIQSINGAAVAMFGYEREEIIGRNIRALMSEPHCAAEAMSFGAGVEGRRRDGSLFPIELTITETKDGASLLFVACVRDLSEKRRAEVRLRQLHLERLAAMGGMAAGLAHELNQPLSANATYLRVAQRLLRMPSHQRPVSVEETLDRAAEQIMRAGRIISSLRGLAAHGEPDKLVLSLHDLIRKTHEFIAGALKETNVKMILLLNAEKDVILADGIQIQQVLTNLVSNAKESMCASDRRVLTISTSLVEKDMIQVDVADTGPGLPDEIKGRLFEPALTTKDKGMGVGLPMSRMIVEAHYGKIWARPEVETGATFSFTLPLAEAFKGSIAENPSLSKVERA
jgi:two-component system sensor kinase FixL